MNMGKIGISHHMQKHDVALTHICVETIVHMCWNEDVHDWVNRNTDKKIALKTAGALQRPKQEVDNLLFKKMQ